ncbi:MAG TPA: NAD-dependent epimerase/dehydratase family protein, partial [Longimicrobiales bacterium]|nr:NAD-dependent epimerase/dehydratase family protein [Longimicrobiales bacterium]
MQSRRDFLTTGAVALASLGARTNPLLAASMGRRQPEARHPLSILILGGTGFLGPHLVAYALGRGHSITTFTRGRTTPTAHRGLFTDVESLTGDRENDLESLRGRSWDAVIDNSGRRAAWTRDSAALLRDSVDVYLYTSSTGVYYPYLTEGITEDTAPVLEMPQGLDEERAVEYGYGVMKANSEMEARAAFGDGRTIVVRPTYMMGPADTSNRFPYWPERLSRGGQVLVPGRIDDPVQYIDVRDVASWMIRLIEDRRAGTFNAVGPASATGMQRFVYGAHAAFASPADFVTVDDYGFLTGQGVSAVVPWIMPVGEN